MEKVRTLIPMVTALKRCSNVDNSLKLYDEVTAGKITTQDFRGHKFVYQDEVESYFTKDEEQSKPTDSEVEAWAKEIKAHSNFFNQ